MAWGQLRRRGNLVSGRHQLMAAKSEEALKKAAFTAMENAYAPYSGFRVGAALATAEGVVIPGCNIENSAYGQTICAETLAVGSAVSQGLKHFTDRKSVV